MAVIIMNIETVGDELELTFVTDKPQTGEPTGQVTQRERRDGLPSGKNNKRNREIKELKRKRMLLQGNGPHNIAHEMLSGQHQTIMLLFRGTTPPFDEVYFRSKQKFVVDIEFDPEFLDNGKPEPVRSPFGWDRPRDSEPYKGPSDPDLDTFEVVKGIFDTDTERKDAKGNKISDTKPTDHKFYKVTVWQNHLQLDPCFFCDR